VSIDRDISKTSITTGRHKKTPETDLDPELVPRMNIMRDLVSLALTTVDQNIIVLGVRYRSNPILKSESSGEEIVPGLVPVMLGFRITVEELLERLFLKTALSDVGDLDETLLPALTEPSFFPLAQDPRALFGGQELVPSVEDLFEHLVDLRVLEDHVPGPGGHGPVEEGVDGHSDEADGVAGVRPRGGGTEDMVQHGEQVREVTDLRGVTGRVLEVGFRMGDLQAQRV
jgi:hypothetical protein